MAAARTGLTIDVYRSEISGLPSSPRLACHPTSEIVIHLKDGSLGIRLQALHDVAECAECLDLAKYRHRLVG